MRMSHSWKKSSARTTRTGKKWQDRWLQNEMSFWLPKQYQVRTWYSVIFVGTARQCNRGEGMRFAVDTKRASAHDLPQPQIRQTPQQWSQLSTYIVSGVLRQASANLERIRDFFLLRWCPLWQSNLGTHRKLPEWCVGGRSWRHLGYRREVERYGWPQSARRTRERRDKCFAW